MPNPLFHPDGPTETRTVRGKKLVVVSAGALGTPGILERSGIGGKEVLEGVGVKRRVDLPGVGENYQGAPIIGDERAYVADCFWTCTDHTNLFSSYFAPDDAETLDAMYSGDADAIAGVFPTTRGS